MRGARECAYPAPLQNTSTNTLRKIVEQTKKQKENPQHVSDSESTSDLDWFNVDVGIQTGLAKFADQDSPATASTVDLVQFDQQMIIDSPKVPADITEDTFDPPNSLFSFSISGDSSSFLEELVQSSSSTLHSQELQIPMTLKSNKDHSVHFFLRFHHENVNEFHRFIYHDYHKFCTTTLMAMVEQSGALRDAVAAFSALIYSMKIDRSARVQAFTYYTLALRELRIILDQDTMDIEECHLAVTTALQLASFDAFSTSLKKLILASLQRCSEMFSTFARRRKHNAQVF